MSKAIVQKEMPALVLGGAGQAIIESEALTLSNITISGSKAGRKKKIEKSIENITKPVLLNAEHTMAFLGGISRSHLNVMYAAGKLPRKIRIGGRIFWSRAELESWTAAGCPNRQRWETMKQEGGRHAK